MEMLNDELDLNWKQSKLEIAKLVLPMWRHVFLNLKHRNNSITKFVFFAFQYCFHNYLQIWFGEVTISFLVGNSSRHSRNIIISLDRNSSITTSLNVDFTSIAITKRRQVTAAPSKTKAPNFEKNLFRTSEIKIICSVI